MSKNTEWSAVSYLAQSKYGLVFLNIAHNNSSKKYTGRSSGGSAGPGGTNTDEGTLKYNTELSSSMLASTKHNVYGVYDMSGGASENVMGNYGALDSNLFGFNKNWFQENKKYFDLYTDLDIKNGSYKGHGIGNEVSGWYNDNNANFNNTLVDGFLELPWLTRGGSYADFGKFNKSSNGTSSIVGTSGLFSYWTIYGDSSFFNGFRTVLIKK